MQEIVDRYFELWRTQNTAGLAEIFLPDAVYIVHPFGVEEYRGLEAIQGYWSSKPAGAQINPQPRIITQAFGQDLAFIEWETTFEQPTGSRKRVLGMLVLEISGWHD